MNKLSFRARALDASKPMPIYMSEELPDLPEYSAINRAVPQMPSGMEKEEECEHHLQRAICTGIIIPTPEVYDLVEDADYDMLYPADYKMPKQLIHMQPFLIDQEVPEYDMDSDDEAWIREQSKKMDINPLKFEEMMDRLEKGCGQTVLELNEAKTLLKEDDDLTVAVYDYWLTKRLNTQHPLIPQVKTESRAPTTATNNPYLAFRRRTEKMQTRKNRKNDEASYEKMLKLRRDLYRAITLLELVKRREKYKRENLQLAIEIYEKRYQAQDFSGSIVNELSAAKPPRPAFTQLYNHLNHNWVHKMPPPKVSPVAAKEDINSRKEKRQYKKRKHRSGQGSANLNRGSALLESSAMPVSSEDDSFEPLGGLASDTEEDADSDGPFTFRRRKNCDSFLAPKPLGQGNWPWTSKEDGGDADVKYRYTLASIRRPKPMTVGFVRRRLGRGGRVILDRASTSLDDYWSTLDFTVFDSAAPKVAASVETPQAAAVAAPPASPGPSTALPPPTAAAAAASVPSSPSKAFTLTAPPLPSPLTDKTDAQLLGELTSDWLHFHPVYNFGDEFSDCQLPFEELDVEEPDFETAPSQLEPSVDFDSSVWSSSKFTVIDASSYVPPKPVSPIPSTSTVVLPPPPAPPPLKTQRLALKDRIYQLQNNRGTTPNGPHSVKAATGIPQPNNTSSPAAITALSPLTPSWTSDAPTSSRLTKPVQPSSTAEPALPGEGGAEMKKESQIPDDQSVDAILRHVMEVT